MDPALSPDRITDEAERNIEFLAAAARERPAGGASWTCYTVCMDLDNLRARLLAMPGASEETPFGPDALVYKVGGKLFALVAWEAVPLRLSLKCSPLHALALRDEFAAVQPGYHFNKRHWNTVTLDGSVPEPVLDAMIQESCDLVLAGLTRRKREEFLASLR